MIRTLLIGFFAINGCIAQESAPTEQFPQLRMSLSTFQMLDANLQKTIADYVIIIDSDLKIVQDGTLSSPVRDSDDKNLIVKTWMSENSHVKIVPRSQYNAADAEVQNLYDSQKIMVLIGEQITLEDIQIFQ